jgi:uncharacterized protein
MATQLTYPGVYVEEIPSGVHTITSVATSIAAFIGWTRKGPTDKAVRILSWEDFIRVFGGLDSKSWYLSYSVYNFFLNGGTDAYIIRLIGANAAPAKVPIGDIALTAKSPGEWANNYSIKTKARTDDATKTKLMLQVLDANGIIIESFENISIDKNDRRFAEHVINEESRIINAVISGEPPKVPPDKEKETLAGGLDGDELNPNTEAFHTSLETAMKYLERVDIFNLLCVPGETDSTQLSKLQKYCRDHRAFLIADSASSNTYETLQNGPNSALTGVDSINAGFYFPWLKVADPLNEGRPKYLPPSGFVAGIYSRTDINRGVWKAPAGVGASVSGVLGVKDILTDSENGVLNQKAVNCIRNFPIYGTVIWGARTLQGNEEVGSEWKYIPVRRMALFIEESLVRGLKWVVFEPNDEPLWSQIRLNVGSFMQDLFRKGAFQGQTPKDAYFVKCDKETTTQYDIDRGIVNILVGFAPLKPAEFVVIKLQQMAGQAQTE